MPGGMHPLGIKDHSWCSCLTRQGHRDAYLFLYTFVRKQLFATYFTKIFIGHVKKRITHARGLSAREAQSLGGEKQIFISTEPVYMNNKLPRRGESQKDLVNSYVRKKVLILTAS